MEILTMRFSTLLTVLAIATFSVAPMACKKKSKGSSGGSSFHKEDLVGLWTNKAKDMFLQFNDTKYSSIGAGVLSTECVGEQDYSLTGSSIVVTKTDTCKDLTIVMKSLSSSVMMAVDGSSEIEMSKVSASELTTIFTTKGWIKKSVTEPFKQFANDTATSSTTTVAAGQYDTLSFSELGNYTLSVTRVTSAGDAIKPNNLVNPFALGVPFRIYFQNGVIVKDDKNISKNTGDMMCALFFRYRFFMKAEDAILSSAVTNLPLQSPSNYFHSIQKYLEVGVAVLNSDQLDGITCEKYGTSSADVFTIGNMRTTFGDFISLQPK